ncbi:MAG: magnesium chelatase, partial [Bacteroidota bacterium]|nr:magnesium chelatase [Bacteroidota bacterium]MDX5505549.1 magnesium chelatase [Bacteroidota bacterium]
LGVINWFSDGQTLSLEDEATNESYRKALDEINTLGNLVDKYHKGLSAQDRYFMMEFLLWGLAEFSKLNKDRYEAHFTFGDLFQSYLSSTLQNDDEED